MNFQYKVFWKTVRVGLFGLLLLTTAVSVTAQSDDPVTMPTPDSVTIAGTIQPDLGCSGEWNTTCAESQLIYDADDDLWIATFDLPAGDYEYKAALNGTWADNYGLNAEYYGPNIPLSVPEDGPVTFWYDHKTRWVSDSINSLVANVPGDFQDEIGCLGDWQPDCLRSLLQDPNGDGVYTFITALIPAGEYEAKVAVNQSWEVNYGVGGEQDGPNISFSVGEGQAVIFSFDPGTNLLTIDTTDDVPDGLITSLDQVGGSGGGLPAPAAPFPDIVVVPGTIQSVLGCAGDWQPECENSALVYDEADQLWFGEFSLPAGEYEYKVALSGSWDVNFGQNAEQGGANIGLVLTEETAVSFFFDHNTGWISDSVNDLVANVPGSFQDEIGCPGDWQPDCLASWLQDPDGDGTFTFRTVSIPAGEYEAKVAVNQSWAENYGEAGALDGANIPFSLPEDDTLVTFNFDSRSKLLTISVGASGGIQGNIREPRAHWVTADTIAWNIDHEEGSIYRFHYDARGGAFSLGANGIDGGDAVTLTIDPNGLSDELIARFPHLRNFTALKFDADDLTVVRIALKGQTAVSAQDSSGQTIDATGLQIPGVLDDLYTYDGDLGVVWDSNTPSLHLWAPTARLVKLHLFADAQTDERDLVQTMRVDPNTGVWSLAGEPEWNGKYYLYEVQVYVPSEGSVQTNIVTDPYSVSLSQNSGRSQIINLADPALMPDGWETIVKPIINAPEDIVIYELHVRDFSVNDDTVPVEFQGTYKAFTTNGTNGMNHLTALADAGLTHLHLLPTFDIATIDEDKANWAGPSFADLVGFDADAEDQQTLISENRDQDPFNWGYDPWHYNVPEGSYATDAKGQTRIVEYREMVQSLNGIGLRVVVDVVYNHTTASGQNSKSVLDRIVPGYYHRLSTAGRVERSTCCDNTATEHNMMRKLMVDSVVLWATMYKVDAFRFDLMGHHMKEDMLAVRAALDALTMEEHGVDGSSIYVYGEGWNFGEVGDNARGMNATQFNLAGTGIGTFNDRLRDAARGGSPFGGRTEQGFVNGLYTSPNNFDQGTPEQQLEQLLMLTDHIRVGLAGNLKEYAFVNADGETVVGRQVLYNGQFAGYTDDPQENIVYISKHDNETLFDIIQYKAPLSANTAVRAQMQNLANSIVMFSQGVPFFQAGDDMLRSKSLDRNSYNSGDWFNRLDFTYQSNNWGVGLPPASDNSEMYDIMQPLLAVDGITPTSEDILFTVHHFRELLQIRQSSPLFRLQTAVQVQERLHFHNTGPDQVPGLIVMSLDDTIGDDLDPNYDGVVVLFNGSPIDQTFAIDAFAGSEWVLHPIMMLSSDSYMLNAAYDVASGSFVVPAWSTAVFILPQTETAVEAEPALISEESEAEMHEDEADHGEEAEADHAEAESLFPVGDEGVERPLTIWIGAVVIGLLLSLLIALLYGRKKAGDDHHTH